MINILKQLTGEQKVILQEDCPRCETEFEVEEFKNGVCPKCNNKYTWDTACEGTFAEYNFLDWEYMSHS